MKRISAILLASIVTLASSARAQSPGTVEITAFANYTWFDNGLVLDDQFGVGGTLSLFFLPHMALEVEGNYTPTTTTLNRDVESIPPRARITANIPLGGKATAFQLGVGYVHSSYRKSVSYDDHGVTGLAGFRLGLTENFALRVNGNIDYVPDPQDNRLTDYFNWGAQAGLSFLFGNRYDKDHDKVADKKDRCPSTPAAAEVDPNGCAATQRDTDGDGLADAGDRCSSTATRDPVDENGCAADQRDQDKDQIADSRDKCPNTKAEESANETGCAPSQVDKDSDGVMDLADRCANSERGPAVDENGCSPAQRDGDKDGVMDVADRCLATPEAERVNADGCPLDSDADGIADATDKCPGSKAGEEVDENGCIRLATTLILRGVTFETGKNVLTEGSEGILGDVAKSLAAHPDVKVEVAGYTDNTGSRTTNVRLSRQRAEAVMKFLAEHGAAPAQLSVQGYGPDKPIASNKTADGRAQNRRVEITPVK